ncbi:MAG: hypothetical protein COA44_14615 [Arcobacter sp.]|nr:MAG: hypothetical protein COA44_14615 [Arcobacter sp.]
MRKFLALLSLGFSLVSAESLELNSLLSSINNYKYETPQGRQMKVPKSTRLVIFAFEKDTGALANDFLGTQDPFYMSKHRAIFIADINRMPTIITNMFALPKMRKYKHLVYLHYEDQFENYIPHKEEQLTLARFKEGKVESITYISTTKELQAAIQK